MKTSDSLPNIDDDMIAHLASHCPSSSVPAFAMGIYVALLLCRLVLNGRIAVYAWDGGGYGTSGKVLRQLKESGLVVDVSENTTDWEVYAPTRDAIDLVNEMVHGIDPPPVAKDLNE